MSNRERWTVYPLLFLTLGIALKDKVTREINTDKVSCKGLWVTDGQGKPQLTLGRTQTGGMLAISGRAGPGILMGHDTQWFGVMLVAPNGGLLTTPLTYPLPAVRQPQGSQPDERQRDQPPRDEPGDGQ